MSPDGASDRHRIRTRRYKGFSTGTFLICAGVVFLLNTTGHVGWSVWWDLCRMWPVLLIAAGLRMIFSRTPLHFLSLAGPALVVAATAWVILHHEEPQGWLDMASASRLEISCPVPAGDDPGFLRLEFHLGDLSVVSSPPPPSSPPAAGPQDGAESSARSPGFVGSLSYLGKRPDLRCDDRGKLRLGDGHPGRRVHIALPFRRSGDAWEYHLSAGRPLRVEAELAAVDADLDLRSFDIVGLDLDAAASDVSLRLGAPARRVPVRIDGGLARLEIAVPEGTCYTIRRDRFLSLLAADDLRVRRRKTVVSNSCTDETVPAYEFRYDLPISSVSVRSEP